MPFTGLAVPGWSHITSNAASQCAGVGGGAGESGGPGAAGQFVPEVGGPLLITQQVPGPLPRRVAANRWPGVRVWLVILTS
jgi:hypothetical protein